VDWIHLAIKSRRMIWTGNVALMEELTNSYENLKGRHVLEDLGGDGSMILEWVVSK
jgi:hypothetical protein